MDSVLEVFDKLTSFLKNYEYWVRGMFCAWVMVSAILAIGLSVGRKEGSSSSDNKPSVVVTDSLAGSELPPSKRWKHVDDRTIDGVIDNLNTLESTGERISDVELANALKPLFTRAAFVDVREESWYYFIYILSESRLILEAYQNSFSDPRATQKVEQALRLMLVLQNEVRKIFGPLFSITEHLSKYGYNKKKFVDNLPRIRVEDKPTEAFIEKRNVEVRKIKSLLKEAGIL